MREQPKKDENNKGLFDDDMWETMDFIARADPERLAAFEEAIEARKKEIRAQGDR